MKSIDYISEVKNALVYALNNSNVYDGEEGALRLAREIGSCLQDFDEKEAYEAFRVSYDICVIGYNLKPPIDKQEWDNAVKQGMNKRW